MASTEPNSKTDSPASGHGGSEAGPAGPSSVRKWLPVGVIAALLGGAWFAGLFDYISLSSIIMHREALGDFVSRNFILGIAGFILLYAGLVAISFPGASLLTIAAGFLFGGLVGGMATVVGATLGAAIIFEVARSSFGDTLEKRTGRFVEKMRKGFQEDSFLYLLTLRLTPVFPFWVINIVPALLKMRLAPYVLATFIGIIPGTLAYSYIGSGLDSVIMAQERANPGCAAQGTCEIDPASLITGDVIIAMVALGIISLLPVVVKKLRGKRQ
ncbi:TVP38/TMEM64 family protein [Salaquimonas pukyongi]|uniref:TVP38/TMEM64 family protein n=1 Tax=Salaquimonas pukyongi TaxID=2712698 RepID=UPI0012EC5A99|nr:VTT domain-containing protein [Salaquimonas pukyongi]